MTLTDFTILTCLGAALCIGCHQKYKNQKAPAWLETLYTLEILAIAIVVIQFLGIELALTVTTLAFAPYWYWAKRRVKAGTLSEESLSYQLASTFPILLILWLVRSFVIQPYRVPSGSLEPTVRIGDFILVNQFKYGLKLPVGHQMIWPIGQPKRGDIALFHWPENPEIIFVKRVIGRPGDHIRYHHHTLFINGKPMKKTHCTPTTFKDPDLAAPIPVNRCLETLPNKHTHWIYENHDPNVGSEGRWTVPPHHYFMMGDNRDNSNDSRFWGAVPEGQFIGQALWVWLSFDRLAWQQHRWLDLIRWHRIGSKVQ